MSRFQLQIIRTHAAIVVDGDSVCSYAIDYRALVCSAQAPGGYFIFTCGCGEPGCAGLQAPVEVEHRNDQIFWHMTDPEPERWFTFGKDQYREAIEAGLADILAILSPNRPDSCFGPNGSTRAGFIQMHADMQRLRAELPHQ